MPFYNEEECVVGVVTDLLAACAADGLAFEIVAIQNGSHDRTEELLKGLATQHPQLRIIGIEVNKGYGFGVINGLKAAQGDYLAYMAGDGQVSPEDVLKVFSAMKERGLDFCQGCRAVRQVGLHRKMVSKVFNTLFRVLFRNSINDIGSNPKIMKRDLYAKILPVSYDWFIDSEVLLKTAALGARMAEVPVLFKKRETGKSHINILAVLEMLRNMFVWKSRVLSGKIMRYTGTGEVYGK